MESKLSIPFFVFVVFGFKTELLCYFYGSIVDAFLFKEVTVMNANDIILGMISFEDFLLRKRGAKQG